MSIHRMCDLQWKINKKQNEESAHCTLFADSDECCWQRQWFGEAINILLHYIYSFIVNTTLQS